MAYSSRKRQRLVFIVLGLVSLIIAAVLIAQAMRDQATFFFPPSEVKVGKAPQGKRFRLGGMVEEGTLRREGALSLFKITDFEASIEARYRGILPDLFREGQGVVAEGLLRSDGVFMADKVLAKHDENYMPREVADSLKQVQKTRIE